MFNVPSTTLQRRVLKYQGNPDKTCYIKGLGHNKQVFNADQEGELVISIKSMESRLFGLTSLELRYLAYQVEKNII